MTEIRRRISTPLSGVSGMPATIAVPELGAISVASVRTVVVLPAPFGPRKPKTSPWPTLNDRSSKARRSPNRFERWSTSRAGGAPESVPAAAADAGGPNSAASASFAAGTVHLDPALVPWALTIDLVDRDAERPAGRHVAGRIRGPGSDVPLRQVVHHPERTPVRDR